MTAATDNDVTFSVYKKTFGDGETVTLGTNGMNGTVVNYTVFVKEAAAVTTAVTTTTTTTVTEAPAAILLGDVNCDGERDVEDAVLLSQLAVESRDVVVTAQGRLNADCNRDGKFTMDDTTLLLQFIAKLVSEL